MQSQMTSHSTRKIRTLKETRDELREWGRFWQRYGTTGGSLFDGIFNNRESVKRPRKAPDSNWYSNPVRGSERQFDARTTPSRSSRPDTSEYIFVPFHLQNIDDFIESLDEKMSIALRQKYIEQNDKADGYWLDRAEFSCMNR